MSADTNTFEKIKRLLKEAYAALADFIRGVAEIKKEEQKISAAASAREAEQKITNLKSRITKF